MKDEGKAFFIHPSSFILPSFPSPFCRCGRSFRIGSPGRKSRKQIDPAVAVGIRRTAHDFLSVRRDSQKPILSVLRDVGRKWQREEVFSQANVPDVHRTLLAGNGDQQPPVGGEFQWTVFSRHAGQNANLPACRGVPQLDHPVGANREDRFDGRERGKLAVTPVTDRFRTQTAARQLVERNRLRSGLVDRRDEIAAPRKGEAGVKIP